MRISVLIVALVSFEALASGSVSRETSEHSYDYALSYCEGKGGLGMYSVQGDIVKFSCADDLATVITIKNT